MLLIDVKILVQQQISIDQWKQVNLTQKQINSLKVYNKIKPMQASKSIPTNTITSHLYNYINIPSSTVLQCSHCRNQEVEKQLQAEQGSAYFRIPDRYVDIYVCNSCKKIDEPKCIHCWQNKPCCSNQEKVLYREYFSSVKKDILTTYTAIANTLNTSQQKSSQPFVAPPHLKQQLMLTLQEIQTNLKRQIQGKIKQNHNKLSQVYQSFQNQLVSKLNPYTPDGIQRFKNETGDRKAIRSMPLIESVNVLKEMENFKTVLEQESNELCDKYIDHINKIYPQILYNKINTAFMEILTPKITYKSALVQQNIALNISPSNSSEKISAQYDLENKIKQADKQLKETMAKLFEKEKYIKQLQHKIVDLQEALKNYQKKYQRAEQQSLKNQITQNIQISSIQQQKLTKQQSPTKQSKVKKQNEGNKTQLDKDRDRSHSWLEQVVNEIDE